MVSNRPDDPRSDIGSSASGLATQQVREMILLGKDDARAGESRHSSPKSWTDA
jgi:hypothetical protein